MKRRIISVIAVVALVFALAAGCAPVDRNSATGGNVNSSASADDSGGNNNTSSGSGGSSSGGGLLDTRVEVTLNDTSDVLINPGKGFMHYGDSDYQRLKERMYLVGTGYHRFNWCDLMDEEGRYDFSKIESWMATYTKFGKPFGFGVMAVNTSSTKEYITPKYVMDGCGKRFVHKDGDNTQYIPDWKDPFFLREVARLAEELGKKFNGNKDVSFVEILSYGNWGEQHLFNIEVEDYPDYRKNESISAEFFKEN